MNDQDDRDTLIEEMRKMPLVDGDDYYEALYVLVESHIKQKIRTATLDEAKEAIKSDEDILINRKHTRVLRIIDNLRGNDENK